MPILLQYQSCRIENAYIMQYNEHEVTMMPGNTNMSVIAVSYTHLTLPTT